MARFKQFHDPELSIWQAAVGEVAAKAAKGAQVQDVGAPIVADSRPDDMDEMSAEAAAYCSQVDYRHPHQPSDRGSPFDRGAAPNRRVLLADGTQNRQSQDSGEPSSRAAI